MQQLMLELITKILCIIMISKHCRLQLYNSIGFIIIMIKDIDKGFNEQMCCAVCVYCIIMSTKIMYNEYLIITDHGQNTICVIDRVGISMAPTMIQN